MARRPPGQPGKFITWFRSFLLGRQMEEFPWYWRVTKISSRFTEQPNLPPGVAHKLAANYYVNRDQRRSVEPPTVVGSQTLLQEAAENVTSEEVAFPQITTPPVPGIGHQWKEKQD